MKSNTPITLAITCLWCWATLLPLRALPLHVFLAGGGGSEATGDPINTAVFTGSQYLRKDGFTPTGWANNKTGTIACWAKFTGTDGVGSRIMTIGIGPDTNTRFIFARATTTNRATVIVYNIGGTPILDLRGTTALTAALGWVHIMACWDLTNSSLSRIYVNGVSETLTVNAVTNDFPYLTDTLNTRLTIGAGNEDTPALFHTGSIGELWFDDVRNDVIGDYYSGGNAVSLGSNGSVPTGSQPPIYYSSSGTGNSWNTNGGTNAALTRTGTLTADATPPTFVP